MNNDSLDVKRFIADILEEARDGQVTPEQLQRFQELLISSPEARTAYLKHNRFSRILASVERPLKIQEEVTISSQAKQTVAFRIEYKQVSWLIGLAASIVIFFFISIKIYESQQLEKPITWEERLQTGTLAVSHGAKLNVADLGITLAEGDALRVGSYELTAGYAQLNIEGVELTLESPAQFKVESNNNISLENGHLAIKVPATKNKFGVKTNDSATAEILSGGETAILATREMSEFHVFEGEVKLRPPNNQVPVLLTQSSASRIESSGPPSGIDLKTDQFLRNLTEPTPNYAEKVQSLSPVVYFRLGSAADGVTLENIASARMNEISVGEVFKGSMKKPPFGPGVIGAGLRLQGPIARSYAAYPHYPKAGKEMTFCAWVRADSRPRRASIAKHWTKLGGQFHLGFYKDDGDLELQVRTSDGDVVSIREHSDFPIGSWQFVAFVLKDSRLRLYRNGVEIGSAPCLGLDMNGPSHLGIGAKLGEDGTPRENAGYWHGRIDELAIFHHALSTEQLYNLYELGVQQGNVINKTINKNHR
jgi:ferric-dicitrate binding protein FerR (iron transport regulator)